MYQSWKFVSYPLTCRFCFLPYCSLCLAWPGWCKFPETDLAQSSCAWLCVRAVRSRWGELPASAAWLVPAAWTRQCFCSFAFSSGGWWTSRRRHGRSQTEGSLTRRRRRGWVHSRTRAKERVDSYLLIGRFDDINAASKSEEISTNNTTYRRCESAVFGSSGLLPRREGGLGEGMLEK